MCRSVVDIKVLGGFEYDVCCQLSFSACLRPRLSIPSFTDCTQKVRKPGSLYAACMQA